MDQLQRNSVSAEVVLAVIILDKELLKLFLVQANCMKYICVMSNTLIHLL